jgi:hypothetical protein
LIESGARLGVSSRGAGSVDGSGVVSGFNFVTVDIVATPSAKGAMPDSIYESIDRSKNGQEIITLAEAVREDPKAQEYLKKEIMAFLKQNLIAKR